MDSTKPARPNLASMNMAELKHEIEAASWAFTRAVAYDDEAGARAAKKRQVAALDELKRRGPQ